jgi:NAD dependent epimerase/dehydratase family enzyme
VAGAVAALDPRPSLLCASAVGNYGQQGDATLTENAPRGEGFLAEVVEAWESAADPAREAGARVVHVRQAPILATHGGGMLDRMLLPFKLCLGGRVGSGNQWWSWVTIDDIVAYVTRSSSRSQSLNLASPNPVRNAGSSTRWRRPPPPGSVPAAGRRRAPRLGDMGGEFLLGGQRAIPPERGSRRGFSVAPGARPTLERPPVAPPSCCSPRLRVLTSRPSRRAPGRAVVRSSSSTTRSWGAVRSPNRVAFLRDSLRD